MLSRFIAQSSLAAAVGLVIMLALALLLADRITLTGASRTMAADLDEISTLEQFMSSFRGRGNRIVLDSDGLAITQAMGMGGMNMGGMGMWGQGRWQAQDGAQAWARTSEVIAKGSLNGTGTLPWVEGDAVWSAKVVDGGAIGQVILVAWQKFGSIREEGWALYAVGIAGILISAILNILVASRTAKRLARGLSEVAETSRKIAAGDYRTSLGSQEVIELDQIAGSLNELADNLDDTTRELAAEKDRLAKLEQSQRRFVADASHEIRAPLASMAITLDAWKDGLLSEEEKVEALGHIRGEVRRLGQLSEQLLDLSRIESGRLSLELVRFDATAVARSVIEAYKGTEGARISLEAEGPMPMAIGDEQGLYRIIRNYLDNARRFTPATGAIAVKIAHSDARIRITVEDNGQGIAAEELEHVWDRFSRSEKERAKDSGGTGLGLAIVKALADAMGAEVRLESEEGKGTRAIVALRSAG